MGSQPLIGTYSASRVSAVIGLNPYKTQCAAAQEMIEEIEPGWNAAHGYELPPEPDSAAIRWGNAFEDAIIKLAELRESDSIGSREKVFKKEIDSIVLSCHTDGLLDSDFIIHEGKTTNARAYYSIKDDKYRWGEPGTDEVPEEYQIQAAVQRICTGVDLVKLSVLVFPKPVDEFEKEGWEAVKIADGEYEIVYKKGEKCVEPFDWAHALAEMGYFHTYNLPTNSALELAIIDAVTDFHERYVMARILPDCHNYDDVRRLCTNPIGTIIANESLKSMALEYSEITRQIGASGPMAKRKEQLKVDIMNEAMKIKKNDWSAPPDKMIIVDPNGGDILVNFSKSGFRAIKAK